MLLLLSNLIDIIPCLFSVLCDGSSHILGMAILFFKHRVLRQLFPQALSLEPNPSTPSRPVRLDLQSTVWAEPERSIGLEHSLVKSTSCWQAIGPAQELWANLGPQIRRLIENSEDILDEGEQKSRNFSIELYMIGHDKTCAVPTVVFSSTSRPKRLRAKALLNSSKLLDKHPAMKICTLESCPSCAIPGLLFLCASAQAAEKAHNRLALF